jgi:hypothetical protein
VIMRRTGTKFVPQIIYKWSKAAVCKCVSWAMKEG